MGRKRRQAVEKPAAEPSGLKKEEKGIDPMMVEEISGKALAYAIENGLQGKIRVSEPKRVEYPRYGYGYQVMLQEEGGKQRMASAHFTADLRPAMWTLDTKGAVI